MSENDELSNRQSDEDASFGFNMRRLREQRGWSQGQMARELSEIGLEGFHQTTISRIEKGERPVRLGEARMIAMLLGSRIDFMMLPEPAVTPIEKLQTQTGELRAAGQAISEAATRFIGVQLALEPLLDAVRRLREETRGDRAMKMALKTMIASAEELMSSTPEDIARTAAAQRRAAADTLEEHLAEAGNRISDLVAEDAGAPAAAREAAKNEEGSAT